jgi:hypothetical protein
MIDFSTYVIGLLGFLTPPLLGLAGAYLVLAGQAWPVRWVVLVLLFVAYLKTRDMFTTVIVLLLGAGIGWVAVRAIPSCRPVLPWHRYGSYCSEPSAFSSGRAAAIRGKPTPRPVPGESKKTSDLTPGLLGLALVWFVAILALWVGGCRLLGI